jgi:hypothetical protein
VADTGIGINDQDIPKLFRQLGKLEQTDVSVSKELGKAHKSVF